MSQRRLIVVDDERDLACFVSEVAEQVGFDTEQYYEAESFKSHYNGDADIIVLDLLLPGTDGVELIRFLSGLRCEARLVLISGFDSGVLHSAQKLAIEQGLHVVSSLSKPFRHDELHTLLKRLADTPSFVQPRDRVLPPSPTESELREAVYRKQLEVYYQPKIRLSDRVTVGMEALLRWRHPQHGVMGPDLFIPLAEHCGLIDGLTWEVLTQVAAQCRRWREIKGAEHLSIAVNMSASTLKELALPERMDEMMRAYGLEPSQLILEVTETSLMQELIMSLDILTRMRMKGFQLAIDDFGTGYSSLVQLHRAPFSEIKIDRSFVIDMETDIEAQTIVETVILLGHKLGMRVVAEGVESEAALDRLTHLGCDEAQGFYLAHPLPVQEVSEWLNLRVGSFR